MPKAVVSIINAASFPINTLPQIIHTETCVLKLTPLLNPMILLDSDRIINESLMCYAKMSRVAKIRSVSTKHSLLSRRDKKENLK